MEFYIGFLHMLNVAYGESLYRVPARTVSSVTYRTVYMIGAEIVLEALS